MRIGLVGYGRMGREIEAQARQAGHDVCVRFEIENPLSKTTGLDGAEVLIDFSISQSVVNTLTAAAKLGVPVVEGTTGWNDQIKTVLAIENLTLLYSANFSIGVHQFIKLVEYAAKLLGPLQDYDCYVHEWHHAGKADSPSGTAYKMAEALLPHLPNKTSVLGKTSEGKIAAQALHVTSTRAGRIPGTHEVDFDSAADFIQLRHQAHGREGFARGAVRAAEWIVGKNGIFTMDDFVQSINQTSEV